MVIRGDKQTSLLSGWIRLNKFQRYRKGSLLCDKFFSGFFFFFLLEKGRASMCPLKDPPNRKQIKWVIDPIEICSVFDMGE